MKFLQLVKGRGFKLLLAGLVTSVALASSAMYSKVHASDHDDGETNIKSRNLSLTDLYVFREDWETANAGDAGNLIMVMNTNPRSLPSQQYFFNTAARYNFHVTRRSAAANGANATVTGVEDLRFEYSFGAPSAAGTQAITMQLHTFVNGTATNTQTFAAGSTTPATAPIGKPAPSVTNVTASGNNTISVFAGLREDPFFLDVESFFRIRATVAGKPSTAQGAFLGIDQAQDFAVGYNVNAIVMRVPIKALTTAANETVFDVWESITVPTATAALQ